jgi:hypothetical protein
MAAPMPAKRSRVGMESDWFGIVESLKLKA